MLDNQEVGSCTADGVTLPYRYAWICPGEELPPVVVLVPFHCLRHTFAMRLLDKGVDIPTIAFFLGHKFPGSSLTYLHCTKEPLEEAIAKLER